MNIYERDWAGKLEQQLCENGYREISDVAAH